MTQDSATRIYCFLDFETSGITLQDFPIQIGLLWTSYTIDKKTIICKELAQYQSLIKIPRKYWKQVEKTYNRAEQIHHIPFSSIKQAPSPKTVLEQIFCIQNKILSPSAQYSFACWNLGFDLMFWNRLLSLSSSDKQDLNKMFISRIDYHHLDVQSLYQILPILTSEKELFKPQKLHLVHGEKFENAHEAIIDATITKKVFEKWLKKFVKPLTLVD